MRRKVAYIVAIAVVALTLSMIVPRAKTANPADIQNAIDNGLAWLAGQQNGDGSFGSNQYRVSDTGLAVLKFEAYALERGEDPFDSGFMYHDQVTNGLNYILTNAHNWNISPQEAGNPDSNGNGIGVTFYTPWDSSHRMYETGICAMAIAQSQHPTMIVTVAGEVSGRTLMDVLIDVVDYIAFGQEDASTGPYRGGWRYSDNYGSADNSISGYAVLGLVYAETPPPVGFGIPIPGFVKTELNFWINSIQDASGGSGYDVSWSWINILKTGNLLQEMAFVGDSASTPRVQAAIGYIEANWDVINEDLGWRPNHKQAMFTVMKGLMAFDIEEITVNRGVPTIINWFNSTNEFADTLIASQNADGSWPNDYWYGNPMASTWALLVLEKAAPVIISRISSCDSNGNEKNLFNVGDSVYVNGTEFSPSTTYDIYVVSHKATWNPGDVIPARIPGTLQEITSDAMGKVDPTVAWSPPLSPGMYDIVVDSDGNGTWDSNEPKDASPMGFLVVQPPTPHDIAITNVTKDTPHQYPGRIVNINVTVKNNGEVSESFNVTAYRDSIAIGTLPINDLAVGENRTMTFQWNTTGLAPCHTWTISAQAPLTGDINPGDNTFTDGTVKIKMWGDTNADGKVDIFDVTFAGGKYGLRAGDPGWDSEADVAAPFGRIDILDIVTIASHYGQMCP